MTPKLNPIQRARMRRTKTMISELFGLGNAIFWTMGLLVGAFAFWWWFFRLIGAL